MHHGYVLIAKNKNGQLTFSEDFQIYHLTFNNIHLEFFKKELIRFKEFIIELEIGYAEGCYNRVIMNRKVPIKTMQHNLTLIFNKQELDGLKRLLTQTDKTLLENLKVSDIDYLLYLN